MKILRTAGAVLAVFALAGCGSSQPSVEIAQPEQAETSQTDSGQESDSGQEQSDPNEPIRPTGGASAPKQQDQKQAPKKTKGSSSEGNSLNSYFKGGKKVGTEPFREATGYIGDAYYFQAPSKVHFCMISKDYVGCQSSNPPANAPSVQYADGEHGKPNGIVMEQGSGPAFQGLTDTAYINNYSGSTVVLQYCQVLEAYGFKCTTNVDSGVICVQGSHGFQFSSKKHKIL
ncbi:hypothetical protein [Brevibacterium ravenspurgense]|uniref:hypothetical protein n=1 Tax=Brevibacterium ravenspurgense TaxID=479117 RepID=UPI00078087A9|nr:hypothetical protein [Brevibacterium ravenspurgense]